MDVHKMFISMSIAEDGSPGRPPIIESTRLSVSDCRTSLLLDAPSANRTEICARRDAPREPPAPGVPNRTARLMHLPTRRNRQWPAQPYLLRPDAAPTAQPSSTLAADPAESLVPQSAQTYLVPTSKRTTVHDLPTAVRPSPPRSSTPLLQRRKLSRKVFAEEPIEVLHRVHCIRVRVEARSRIGAA
jgi:hypothetical protein